MDSWLFVTQLPESLPLEKKELKKDSCRLLLSDLLFSAFLALFSIYHLDTSSKQFLISRRKATDTIHDGLERKFVVSNKLQALLTDAFNFENVCYFAFNKIDDILIKTHKKIIEKYFILTNLNICVTKWNPNANLPSTPPSLKSWLWRPWLCWAWHRQSWTWAVIQWGCRTISLQSLAMSLKCQSQIHSNASPLNQNSSAFNE